ncbi:hypothetical protein ACFE04_022958 [Oxalis oulophora]
MRLAENHKEYSDHQASIIKHVNKLKMMDLLLTQIADTANTQPYVNSPLTLPPYDSLPPTPLPQEAPPFCVFPPNIPQTPSVTIPSPPGFEMPSPPSYYLPPVIPSLSPPPSPTGEVPSPIGQIPSPTIVVPSPPPSPTGEIPSPRTVVPSPPDSIFTPSPPQSFPNPPVSVPSPTTNIPTPSGPILTPPYYEPTPPGFTPTPPGRTLTPPPYYVPSPSPPVFQPPIIYPAPNRGESTALWCVVKPSVPDPIVQEAMSYACGSGADCDSILPDGACFEPNTLWAHASYAFNSYWQRTKVAGGSCSFGGTSMLVTVDPSKVMVAVVLSTSNF